MDLSPWTAVGRSARNTDQPPSFRGIIAGTCRKSECCTSGRPFLPPVVYSPHSGLRTGCSALCPRTSFCGPEKASPRNASGLRSLTGTGGKSAPGKRDAHWRARREPNCQRTTTRSYTLFVISITTYSRPSLICRAGLPAFLPGPPGCGRLEKPIPSGGLLPELAGNQISARFSGHFLPPLV